MTLTLPATLPELDDLVFEANVTGGHTELAEQLESGLDGGQGAVSQAELLIAASEQWRLAGDAERAVALCRQAVDCNEPSRIDLRAHLAAALRDAGRGGEARGVLAELRSTRPRDLQTLLFAGKQAELLGDLTDAHTWYTRGLTLAERQSEQIGMVFLLVARHRVRGRLGYPHDIYDELADELRKLADSWLAETGPRHRPTERKARKRAHAAGDLVAVASRQGGHHVIDLVAT